MASIDCAQSIRRLEPSKRTLRILVAIASYGDKNARFLKEIVKTYQSMTFRIDVVVLAEAPKDLGPNVEVVVGLPSKNPWTLPFAHKAILAKRVDKYDLFIYSEDDIQVTERHIRAFLNATVELEQDEIAGFVRYEIDHTGKRFVNEPWKHYHWKSSSVRRRGSYTIAEFTNEHTGLYILTQHQLRRAIASGGFLRGPCRGRYDFPETAATDPYTNCGFRKVICISALEDFLVHHMPNPYVTQLDVSLESFAEQVQTLMDIRDGTHPPSTLCDVESPLWPSAWEKMYYEKPTEQLLSTVPFDAKRILSIGSGWGATEARLQVRGSFVTALPLDSVIGAAAERLGIDVVYGTWDECLQRLHGQTFDCVLMTNLLHLHRSPEEMIAHCLRLTRPGGSLVFAGPNFDRAPWLLKRIIGLDGYQKLRRFELSGVSLCSPTTLARFFKCAGARITTVKWINHEIDRAWLRKVPLRLGRITARDWIIQAHRLS
ncbi:MAG TPA: methyltransferase domain-containing protein [Terrimicrobiaceae bacterium]